MLVSAESTIFFYFVASVAWPQWSGSLTTCFACVYTTPIALLVFFCCVPFVPSLRGSRVDSEVHVPLDDLKSQTAQHSAVRMCVGRAALSD